MLTIYLKFSIKMERQKELKDRQEKDMHTLMSWFTNRVIRSRDASGNIDNRGLALCTIKKAPVHTICTRARTWEFIGMLICKFADNYRVRGGNASQTSRAVFSGCIARFAFFKAAIARSGQDKGAGSGCKRVARVVSCSACITISRIFSLFRTDEPLLPPPCTYFIGLYVKKDIPCFIHPSG